MLVLTLIVIIGICLVPLPVSNRTVGLEKNKLISYTLPKTILKIQSSINNKVYIIPISKKLRYIDSRDYDDTVDYCLDRIREYFSDYKIIYT